MKIEFLMYNSFDGEIIKVFDLYWFEENFVQQDGDFGWHIQNIKINDVTIFNNLPSLFSFTLLLNKGE